MKKRIISAVTAMIMCFTTPVFAQLSVGIIDGNKVSVQYTNEAGDPSAKTLYIFKPGVDVTSGITKQALQSLLRIEESAVGAGIIYTYDIANDMTKGKYTVVVGGNYESIFLADRTSYFIYATAEEKNTAFAQLNGAIDGVGVKTALTEWNESVWDVDLDMINSIPQKDDVFEVMYQLRGTAGWPTREAVEQAITKAYTIVALRTATAASGISLLKANGSLLGIGLTDDQIDNFAPLFVKNVSYVNDGKLEDVTDVLSVLSIAQAIFEVNSAKSEVVIAVLKKHNAIFSLDFTGDYASLDEAKVATAMYNKSFETVDDVKEKFSGSISSLLEQKDSNTGGKSSSSVGSSSIGVVSVPTVDIANVFKPQIDMVFSDITEAEWARDAIDFLYIKQIMVGNGDGTCTPNRVITREEFVKLLITAFGFDLQSGSMPYGDVSEDSWYYNCIMSASKIGIVNGIDDNTFGVGMPVTREDGATMLYRALSKKSAISKGVTIARTFSDGDKISSHAKTAVEYFVSKNIINGFEDNSFRPQDGLTRAQAAVILHGIIG